MQCTDILARVECRETKVTDRNCGNPAPQQIEADKLPDGRIVIRAAVQNGKIAEFVGCLSQKKGPKLSIDEINEIASRAWAKAK